MVSKRKALVIASVMLVVIVAVPVGMYFSYPSLFQIDGVNSNEPTSTPLPSPSPTLLPSPSPTLLPSLSPTLSPTPALLPTPTPVPTQTPSPTPTPSLGSYDKSIIINTDNAEEENALSVAENINYTSIFKVERFYCY